MKIGSAWLFLDRTATRSMQFGLYLSRECSRCWPFGRLTNFMLSASYTGEARTPANFLFKRELALQRPTSPARLIQKTCISESTQCFHLEFEMEELESFDFAPGQFLSAVAVDGRGKSQ